MPYQDTACEFLHSGTTSLCVSELPEDEKTCSICWEPMTHAYEYDETSSSYKAKQDYPVRIKVCGHVFGRACLSKHTHGDIPSSSLCPLCRAPLFGFEYDQDDEVDGYAYVQALVQEYDAFVTILSEERRELKRLRHKKERIIRKELKRDPHAPLSILLINEAMIKEVRKIRSRRHQLRLIRRDIRDWVDEYDMEPEFAEVKEAVRSGESLEYAWEEFIGFGV